MTDRSDPLLSRREFARRLALGSAALAGSAALGGCSPRPPTPSTGADRPVTPASTAQRRPNILLIVSDQERGWDDLPNNLGLSAHDWLRERGTSFSNYNVHTTPCSPSRACLYTGLHTQINGMTSNIGAPPFPKLAPVPTLGHLMREQGYYTAYKGKWHLSEVPTEVSVRYGPFRSARDVLEPFGFADYSDVGIADGATWSGFKFDAEVASAASQWLHQTGRHLDQPWLLAVNFVNPHDIVFYDDEDRAQSRSRLDRDYLSPLSPPPTSDLYRKFWDLPLPNSWAADDLSTKPWAQRSYVEFCAGLYGRIDPKDESRWRRYQSYYYNCIRDVDAHTLTVLEHLQRLGLDDNTVIVYTSDHGDMLGAHGLRQKGPTMYKENVRVPLIVCHPDHRSGATTQALAGPIDVLPTLLGIAGLTDAQRAERYPSLKGVNLMPAVADATARTERDARGVLYDYNTTLYIDPEAAMRVIASHEDAGWWPLFKANLALGHFGPRLDHPGLFRGVHDGRWKFARYFRADQHHIPKDWATLLAHNELELYDTAADPDELVNLAANPEAHRDTILALNAKTNALIEHEIGFDDGREHIGPTFLFDL